MTKELINRYMNKIKHMDDKEHLYAVLSYNIAPTLAGHKPSSIITLNNNRGLSDLWNVYKNDFLNESKLEAYELKNSKNNRTLLFYNNNELFKTLTEKNNIKFLSRFNYSEKLSLEEMLKILKSRFENVCPHEMGIFLGFPLEDVICFMDYPDKPCLMCGYWKVYNNLEFAKEKFLNYDDARKNIVVSILKGVRPSVAIKG